MMTGTMTELMWLMMSLMLLGSAVRGITWARRRRRGTGLSASPSARQAPLPRAKERPRRCRGHRVRAAGWRRPGQDPQQVDQQYAQLVQAYDQDQAQGQITGPAAAILRRALDALGTAEGAL